MKMRMYGSSVLLALVVLGCATLELEAAKHRIAAVAPSDPFAYSGYLQVNQSTGASLFYWFFEAQNKNASAPVILWLQGGPGSSSVSIGLLNELGPYRVSDKMQLVDNPYSWNKNYHVIFIDQPVGTGFSFTGTGGYVTNAQQVVNHLYSALTQFFRIYSAYAKNDFYIFGESYGGKYVPYIANYILQQGSLLPFKGIGIGNGLSDPITQVATFADQAYNLGLLDDVQRLEVMQLQRKCIQLTEAQLWNDAADARTDVLNYITEASGDVNFYDVRTYEPYNWTTAVQYLNLADVRKQLHVGNHMFNPDSIPIAEALKSDMMKSVKSYFPNFLSKIKVLLYQGQFDMRDGVASNEAWINTIPWSGQAGFYNATRQIWKVNDNVAGYVKNFKALTHVMVTGAGHMVPMNQPLHAQFMVSNFIENKQWKN